MLLSLGFCETHKAACFPSNKVIKYQNIVGKIKHINQFVLLITGSFLREGIGFSEEAFAQIEAISAKSSYLLRVRIRMLLLLYRRRVSTQVCAKMISIWYSWNETNNDQRSLSGGTDKKERCLCGNSGALSSLWRSHWCARLITNVSTSKKMLKQRKHVWNSVHFLRLTNSPYFNCNFFVLRALNASVSLVNSVFHHVV